MTYDPTTDPTILAAEALRQCKSAALAEATAADMPISVATMCGTDEWAAIATDTAGIPTEDELAAEKAAAIARKRAKFASESLNKADLPERQFKRATGESGEIDRTGKWGVFLARVEANITKGATMVICGPRGTGKTQLAVCAAIAAAGAGRSPLYSTAFDFFLRVRETYRQTSRHSEREIILSMVAPDFLILDEIHERGETAWEDRLLTNMIDRRYQAGKTTLILSNMDEQETSKALGPSVSDRMTECGGIATLDGESRRQKGQPK